MMNLESLVYNWLRSFEVPLDTEPTEADLKWMRRLIIEEAAEACDELTTLLHGATDPRPVAKELADTIWVCLVAMHKLGLPVRAIFKAIYDSNMTKLPVTKDAGGKIQKGPNYKPANLDFLVRDTQ